MEGWIARSDLIDPRRLKELSRRSDAVGALQTGSQLLALVLGAWAIDAAWGTWWVVPAIIFQGVVLWGYGYAGQHELLHRTVFSTRWLNDWAGYIAGFVRFFPTDYSRAWHFVHHRNTKDPDKDSELIGNTPLTLGSYLWFLSGIDFLWWRLAILFRAAGGRRTEPYFTDAEFKPLVTEARVHVALYAILLVGSVVAESTFLLKVWILPLILTTPFYRLYISCEHYGRPQVKDILASTRTTRAGPILTWLMWNMPYHTEHHLFPGVPFYRLGAVSRELRASTHAAVAENEVAPGHLTVVWRLIRGLARGEPSIAYR